MILCSATTHASIFNAPCHTFFGDFLFDSPSAQFLTLEINCFKLLQDTCESNN